MKQAILIQIVACCSGLAGVYLAGSIDYQWVLAILIVASAAAAIAVAWSERDSKAFIERALESLILSSKPNDFARERVISAINKQAGKISMPRTQFLNFTGGITKLRFMNKDELEVGVIVINDETISRLAVMPDKELHLSAKNFFFRRNKKLARTHNELIDAISLGVRTTLWEEKIPTPSWCMWIDDTQITLPIIPPNDSCAEIDKVRFLKDEFENLELYSDFSLFTEIEARVRRILENTR